MSIPVCLCGKCYSGRPVSSVAPGAVMDVAPDCACALVRQVLGVIRCPSGHFLIYLPSNYHRGWSCDVCSQHGETDRAMPRFRCQECDYDVCARCAALAAGGMKQTDVLGEVIASGLRMNIAHCLVRIGERCPIFYCGGRYTSSGKCLCGTCDGQCGPNNGCPCQNCIVTLEMVLLSSGTRCSGGHLLSCVLYRSLPSSGIVCRSCGARKTRDGSDRWAIGLGCEECGYESSFICVSCALDSSRPIPWLQGKGRSFADN